MGLTLSLDSATVIDLIRGRRPEVRRRYREAAMSGQEMVLSAVVMHELIVGITMSRNPTIERKRLVETTVGLPVVDLIAADVEATGRIAGDLRQGGRPIGDLDTLIAGQALARGWTVVTRNVRHFGRVEGLSLVDWSVGSEPLSEKAVADRVREAD